LAVFFMVLANIATAATLRWEIRDHGFVSGINTIDGFVPTDRFTISGFVEYKSHLGRISATELAVEGTSDDAVLKYGTATDDAGTFFLGEQDFSKLLILSFDFTQLNTNTSIDYAQYIGNPFGDPIMLIEEGFGESGVFLTQVPVPASIWLTLSALAGLILIRQGENRSQLRSW
ncbi:MAG: VPLPA-CTERM sorting domain-containing protein, partial [Pseudomonadota bacterium]